MVGLNDARSNGPGRYKIHYGPAYLLSSVTRSGHAAKWSNAVASAGQSFRRADFRSRTPDESTSGIGATRQASTTARMHVSTTATSCGRPSSGSMCGIPVIRTYIRLLHTLIAATDTAASRPCTHHRAALAPLCADVEHRHDEPEQPYPVHRRLRHCLRAGCLPVAEQPQPPTTRANKPAAEPSCPTAQRHALARRGDLGGTVRNFVCGAA
jgi:hypothetical protein